MMTIRIILIIVILFFTLSCGFKPIHKLSDTDTGSSSYSIQIINNVSREIKEEIGSNIITGENERFSALLRITENLTPLIINTNGTVAKYRIEILINYRLIEVENNKELSTGTVRGSAQYDVGTSEISNQDTKRSMTKIATKNAVQLMVSKLQSSISKANDN